MGLSWGFTTPYIRRAAINYSSPSHPSVNDPANGWMKRKPLRAFFAVWDLLRCPTYMLPLVLNLTGSVWFFLLVGKTGKSARIFQLGGERKISEENEKTRIVGLSPS